MPSSITGPDISGATTPVPLCLCVSIRLTSVWGRRMFRVPPSLEVVVYYEDVKVVAGETVSGLAVAYGYKAADWVKIWNDNKNAELVKKRGIPNKLGIGDVVQIPIPWKVTNSSVAPTPGVGGVTTEFKRDGGKGTRLSWVQTVYQANQPVTGTTPFCVDGCPPDDDLPFYWTDAEIAADPTLRQKFTDAPSRTAPSAAAGTTTWRAVTSIAVITGKRVTVYESHVWGFNLTPANVVTKVGPRDALANEVSGHLNLLRKGVGTAAGTFSTQGWTFRPAP